MNEYILSCCSTADLSEEHFRSRAVSYICFHYELDGVQYMDDLGKTMSFDKFYSAMANGADTKTTPTIKMKKTKNQTITTTKTQSKPWL